MVMLLAYHVEREFALAQRRKVADRRSPMMARATAGRTTSRAQGVSVQYSPLL
jgi:hypothetical protein